MRLILVNAKEQQISSFVYGPPQSNGMCLPEYVVKLIANGVDMSGLKISYMLIAAPTKFSYCP
jgi:hypothetical protein